MAAPMALQLLFLLLAVSTISCEKSDGTGDKIKISMKDGPMRVFTDVEIAQYDGSHVSLILKPLFFSLQLDFALLSDEPVPVGGRL